MPQRGPQIAYELRCAIITLRCLCRFSFEVIEQKTGVIAHSAKSIYIKALKRAKCENFHELLINCGHLGGQERQERMSNDTQLSTDIREAILKHSRLKSAVAVLDQENIHIPKTDKEWKLPSRYLIEKIQHQHKHISFNGNHIQEIVRGRASKKPRTTAKDNAERKKFCISLLKKLNQEAIFICTDETYHEISIIFGLENIFRSREAISEVYARSQDKVKFIVMQ